MKQFLVLLSLIFIICFSISCKKASHSPSGNGNPQMPFQTAVNNKSIVNTKISYTQNTAGAETGYKLHFTTNGKITQLGAEMGTPGSYPVSFWDFSTQQLLATVNVNVTDTTHFFYVSLPTAIDVSAGTEYALSLHLSNEITTEHWLYSNASGTKLYPFTTGDVIADELLDMVNLPKNATPVFPSTYYAVDQYYLYDCDLVYTPSN